MPSLATFSIATPFVSFNGIANFQPKFVVLYYYIQRWNHSCLFIVTRRRFHLHLIQKVSLVLTPRFICNKCVLCTYNGVIAWLQCARYFKNYTCLFALSVNVLTILVPGTSECPPCCMLMELSFIMLHICRRGMVGVAITQLCFFCCCCWITKITVGWC